MPLRVVLTGSECTGKSTLAEKLAAHFKVEFATEYLRNYFEKKNGILTVEDALPIALGQLELENHLIKKRYNPIICDTDIISSIVYSKHYFNHVPKEIEKIFKILPPSLYLLCDIDIEWQHDGQRDMQYSRHYMQNLFSQELINRKLTHHIISGSLERRTIKSIDLISSAM